MQDLSQRNSRDSISARIGKGAAITGLLLGLVSCGGGGGGAEGATPPATYLVSGAVAGLTGTGLVLQNNGADDKGVNANGTFTFSTPLTSGTNYSVSIKTQPSGPIQTCTVNSGSGTLSGANIINVSVVCSTNTYTVTGSVSGLAGTGLVLQNNSADDINISANGSFNFPSSVASGANYSVTVKTQPSGPAQTCTVNSGNGIMTTANITNVTVTCSTTTYTVSGTVSGLAGAGLVLQNNGGNDLHIAADGTFSFTTPVVSGANFNVTVKTQPSSPSQTCTVSGSTGSGIVSSANIGNVTVLCSTNTYSVSGTVSGLAGSGLILQNNGSNDEVISVSGNFTFTTPVASGANFKVTVKTQPSSPNQTCSVSVGGSGTVTNANVSGVTVLCSTNSYTVSGTISGLAGTGLVLQDNGTDDKPIAANGAFTFTTSVASGANYNVTVKTQPNSPSQTCTVSGGTGTGTMGSANINNVAVLCSTNAYTVRGTVSGLFGTGLILQNNGGNDQNIPADGAFAFTTPVASGANYLVTVKTQPTSTSQTCTVSAGGSGTVTNANVSGVTVLCAASAPSFAIGGKAIGIAAGNSIVLQNKGGDDVTITANGPFKFPTEQVDSSSYNVSVKTPPTGNVCALTYGWDKVRSEHVTNVDVICGPKPSGSFSAAASLNIGRDQHSATLLPDGRLLVAGGFNFTSWASTELYDPATNIWAKAASMITPRYNHTATLLPNGRVLVTGGYDNPVYLASAELYDPATDTWTSAGNMSVARLYHTATLLRNGKVLVVGGTYGPALTASAELYDPATNTWSSAGSVGTARYMHTATLLNNGKVLIAAGATGTPAIASAKLYDPETNTWSVTGSLATARAYPTANMLPSGKVLVTGGFDSAICQCLAGVTASAELYDPETGMWSSAGNMANARLAHTAISGLLPTGKVLIAGGHNTLAHLTSAEVYDPETNSWSTTGSLAVGRAFHSATLLSNGRMLIVGGATCMASTEIY